MPPQSPPLWGVCYRWSMCIRQPTRWSCLLLIQLLGLRNTIRAHLMQHHYKFHLCQGLHNYWSWSHLLWYQSWYPFPLMFLSGWSWIGISQQITGEYHSCFPLYQYRGRDIQPCWWRYTREHWNFPLVWLVQLVLVVGEWKTDGQGNQDKEHLNLCWDNGRCKYWMAGDGYHAHFMWCGWQGKEMNRLWDPCLEGHKYCGCWQLLSSGRINGCCFRCRRNDNQRACLHFPEKRMIWPAPWSSRLEKLAQVGGWHCEGGVSVVKGFHEAT